MKKLTLGAIALVASTMIGISSAMAVPIVPSPVVVSGNITFDNFSCASTGVSCSNIQVFPYVSTTPPDPAPGEFGIQITGNFTALAGQALDTTIRYDAHIAGGAVFTDASMFYNGTPITSITELIFNIDTGNLIGQLSVTNPPQDLTDHIVLSENATNIRVVKDIAYAGSGTQGTISVIDQTFSQQIPEPASLALLGAALACFGIMRRRWRKTA